MQWVLLIILIGVFIYLITGNRRIYSWRCSHCDHIFEISWLINRISPRKNSHLKLLKCPACHRLSWAKQIKRVQL
ncbi:MAG: hypothetical protein GX295_06035 [Syntrophomonadaceae bacterium]|nr:hypothetical protein [Syntrophomonadaceae bacterium]